MVDMLNIKSQVQEYRNLTVLRKTKNWKNYKPHTYYYLYRQIKKEYIYISIGKAIPCTKEEIDNKILNWVARNPTRAKIIQDVVDQIHLERQENQALQEK